jgi:hypothetical protein
LLNLFLGILIDSFSNNSNESEEYVLDVKLNSNIQKRIQELEEFHDSYSDSSSENFLKKKNTILDKVECERSYFIFSKHNSIRSACYKMCTSQKFDNFFLLVIYLNSIKLVIDTYILDYPNDSSIVQASLYLDIFFTILYTLEFLIKSVAFGFIRDKLSYLEDNWNKLDFIIVVLSLVDLSVAGVNIPIIKIFRVLRGLRPLKLIKHNASLRIVVQALFASLGAILNLLTLILLIFFIFAILAVSLLGGKLHYCANQMIQDQIACQAAGFAWVNTNSNYDNIFEAMIVLFIIMSQETWPNRMLEGMSARGIGLSPVSDYNVGMSAFYCTFLFIANFFLLSLFTVVVFDKFTEAKRNESSLSALLLDKDQLLWTEIQKLVIKAKPEAEAVWVPREPLRRIMWRVSKSRVFEVLITVVIVANMFAMSIIYNEASTEYTSAINTINEICSFVFIGEAIVKIVGLGQNYFKSSWNRFDFSVTLISLVDVVITYAASSSVPLLRQGPQLLRVFRVFRVLRIFRLIKSFRAIQNLLTIIIYSLPAILNVFGLMTLVFFMYAVLGAFMFHKATGQLTLDNYYNFSNFSYSMVILWRISTGEDYPSVMWDLKTYTNTYWPVLYILSFIGIVSFLILELFISVILQNYEEISNNPYNAVNMFGKDLRAFRKYWIEETADKRSVKINKEKLISLIGRLGFEFKLLTDNSRLSVLKTLGSMAIEMDHEGHFYFNDILYAVLKKKYSKKFEKKNQKIIVKLMRMEEHKTRNLLRGIRSSNVQGKDIGKKKNYFTHTLILKTIFKSWKNYAFREKGEHSITPQFSEIEYPGENSEELMPEE